MGSSPYVHSVDDVSELSESESEYEKFPRQKAQDGSNVLAGIGRNWCSKSRPEPLVADEEALRERCYERR